MAARADWYRCPKGLMTLGFQQGGRQTPEVQIFWTKVILKFLAMSWFWVTCPLAKAVRSRASLREAEARLGQGGSEKGRSQSRLSLGITETPCRRWQMTTPQRRCRVPGKISKPQDSPEQLCRTADNCGLPPVGLLLDRREEWPDGTAHKNLGWIFVQECVERRISGPATESVSEGGDGGKGLH